MEDTQDCTYSEFEEKFESQRKEEFTPAEKNKLSEMSEEQAIDLLNGRIDLRVKPISKSMKEYSKPEEYEIRQKCIEIASELRIESGDKMSLPELLDKAQSIYEYIIKGK